MTVLVTGANGFIGSNLVSALRARGRPVRAVRRTPAATLDKDQVSVGDIDAQTDWERALAGVDAVVHLAARVHVLREHDADPETAFRRTNVDGTARLAASAAAHGVRRFVFVSSIGVHGQSSTNGPISEASPLAPHDAYTRSKLAAEEALRAIGAETGMEIVILRPPLVYGPRNPGNFLRLLQLVRLGLPLPFGAIANARSMIYIDNLVDLLVTCLDHPAAAGQAFIATDGARFSTSELVTLIATGLGRKPRLLHVPPRALLLLGKLLRRERDVHRLLDSYETDGRKLQVMLDWRAPIAPAEGIRRTVEWYKNENLATRDE